jgi:RHS repeat-associated protein
MGTPRLATDVTQQVVWRWNEDAFGASVAADQDRHGHRDHDRDHGRSHEIEVNLRYPGQYYDTETGLFYNWNRYYNPNTGRYSRSDPIGLSGGVNTFGYVSANPLGFIDPWGLYKNGVPYDPGIEPVYPEAVVLPAVRMIGVLSKIVPSQPVGECPKEEVTKRVATQFEKKIEKQMGKRGWDKDSVNSTIENPNRTVSTSDTRWKSDGTRRDDPATAYIREDGHYVVRNNNDGTIVQISNRNATDWKSPFE